MPSAKRSAASSSSAAAAKKTKTAAIKSSPGTTKRPRKAKSASKTDSSNKVKSTSKAKTSRKSSKKKVEEKKLTPSALKAAKNKANKEVRRVNYLALAKALLESDPARKPSYQDLASRAPIARDFFEDDWELAVKLLLDECRRLVSRDDPATTIRNAFCRAMQIVVIEEDLEMFRGVGERMAFWTSTSLERNLRARAWAQCVEMIAHGEGLYYRDETHLTTVLHLAVQFEAPKEIIQSLIQTLDVNAPIFRRSFQTNNLMSSAELAIAYRPVSDGVLDLLLEAGALHRRLVQTAIERGKFEAIPVLAKHGVDMDDSNEYRAPALWCMIDPLAFPSHTLEVTHRIVVALLLGGVDPTKTYHNGSEMEPGQNPHTFFSFARSRFRGYMLKSDIQHMQSILDIVMAICTIKMLWSVCTLPRFANRSPISKLPSELMRRLKRMII